MSLWAGAGQRGAAEDLALAEALGKDRDRLEHLLAIGVEWVRDILVFRATGEEKLLVYGRGAERYRGVHAPLQRMLADMDLLTRSRELLESRVSAQLVAENLLFRLGRA